MAEETGASEVTNTTTATDNQAKLFTQADLDAIVADRLRRERKKYADFDKKQAAYEEGLSALEEMRTRVAELEAEKTAREKQDAHKALVDKVMSEKGIDAKFAPLMTAADEDGLIKQAQLLAEGNKFADVSRREGGKPAGATGGTTAEQFAEFMDSQF